MTKHYGLIGYPLSHSFSQKYFTEKFKGEHINNCVYSNYPLTTINKIEELLTSNHALKGLNVTIPYKESVIPFMDELEEEARTIGAINTIKITTGYIKGFNTDIYGFVESLKPLVKDRSNIKALILGTGGASKAIAFGLKKMDIPHQFISRKETENAITYAQLTSEQVKMYQLIINTTPLGMYPKVENCPPIAYGSIEEEHILYDLVYNPEETLFLSKGKERGAVIKNGLEMLHLQAEKAWEIWNI